MRPTFRKNVRESRDSCTVRCRGVGAEDIVEKCAKLYRPGINIQMRKTFKCAKLYCPGTNKCAKLYRPGTNVHRLVCAVTHSRKGMLCTLNLDINKRCVPFYTKIIFRSGTKVYAVVQHLSQVQKNLVLLIFHGWCSYDFLQAGLYVPGTDLWGLKSRCKKSWFVLREIRIFGSWYKWLNGSRNPQIKVHQPQNPNFRKH